MTETLERDWINNRFLRGLITTKEWMRLHRELSAKLIGASAKDASSVAP